MKFTVEQTKKAKTAKSAEELFALAKENGIEMTEEEANKYFADFHKEGELSDEELDNVSGGCGDPHEKHLSWNEKNYPMEYENECPVCGGTLTYIRWDSCTHSKTTKIYHCPVGDVDFRVDWLGEHHRHLFTRI